MALEHAMKTMIQVLFIFTSAFVSLATDRAHLSQENDIREAVFRYQFDHNSSGQQENAGVYCLSVGEKQTDPSDELMKRFTDHRPPVRKVSECNVDAKGVVEKHTGKPGLVFRVTSIRWISDTEVEVAGGYYEGGVSSSDNTYALTKQNGKWKVSKDNMNWISQRLELFPVVSVEKSPLHSLTRAVSAIARLHQRRGDRACHAP